MPLVPAAARFHRDHGLREAPILGQKWCGQNVHGLDAVYRNALSEAARGGVCNIRLVDHHGASLLAGAIQPELAASIANHSRDQWQRIVDRRRIRRQRSHFRGAQFVVLRSSLLHRRTGLLHLDARGLHFRRQHQPDFDFRRARNFNGPLLDFESFGAHRHAPGPARYLLEIGEAGSLRGSAAQRILVRSQLHVGVKHRALLGIDNDHAQLAGRARLSDGD